MAVQVHGLSSGALAGVDFVADAVSSGADHGVGRYEMLIQLGGALVLTMYCIVDPRGGVVIDIQQCALVGSVLTLTDLKA